MKQIYFILWTPTAYIFFPLICYLACVLSLSVGIGPVAHDFVFTLGNKNLIKIFFSGSCHILCCLTDF